MKATRYKTSKLNLVLVGILLILLIILSIIYFKHAGQNNRIDTLAQIYGGLAATFIGVYLSLHLAKTDEIRQDHIAREKVVTGALKLIWSELDINKDSLNNLLLGVNSIPRKQDELSKIYEKLAFINEYSKGIKTKAFYNSISSGAMNEISLNDRIFNALQQAYYNLELTINGLLTSSLVFKDYEKVSPNEIEGGLVKSSLAILDKESEKIESSIEFVNAAINCISAYLKEQDVTFKKGSTEPN